LRWVLYQIGIVEVLLVTPFLSICFIFQSKSCYCLANRLKCFYQKHVNDQGSGLILMLKL